MARFCVIGSLNMDLTAVCDRFPRPGETVLGSYFKTSPGGKGGNQAVALAFLETEVYMIGCLGEDMYGKRYLTHLDNTGVETSGVEMIEDVSSGIACISVVPGGANKIIVIPGSNMHVTPPYIARHAEILQHADFVMLQGEIPYETILYSAKLAKSYGCTTVFDPAPVGDFPKELYEYVDIITPNEGETEQLTGIRPENDLAIFQAAAALKELGVGIALLKAGSGGAYVYDGSEFYQIEGDRSVEAVDTTAAGDAFAAGLVYTLGQGRPLDQAVAFANIVAAMSIERLGAQSAMPSLDEAVSRSERLLLKKRTITIPL